MLALDQSELTSADVLFIALSNLGVSPSVDSFEARKRIQKLGYILQKCGILPSYEYSWYLQGPYSSELSNDLYSIVSNRAQFMSRNQSRSFSSEARDRLGKLSGILNDSVNDTQLLEAIASILYLGPDWEVKLRSLKPNLPSEQVERANRMVQAMQRENLLEAD